MSCFSSPIQWLVHGHTTSKNETAYTKCHEGNIVKTVTSNAKQVPVTHEMLTTVACDQIMQLRTAWCCHWNLSSKFTFIFIIYQNGQFDPFVLLCNKSLNDWSIGEQWILFPSNLNVSLDFLSVNIKILRKQNSMLPS